MLTDFVNTLSAAATAAIGTIYVQFNYFFDPGTVFGLADISVRMALVAIVGGIGSIIGPIVGAIIIIPLEEIANATLQGQMAGVSAFTYGAILITIILIEPRGLVALWRRLRARLSRSVS